MKRRIGGGLEEGGGRGRHGRRRGHAQKGSLSNEFPATLVHHVLKHSLTLSKSSLRAQYRYTTETQVKNTHCFNSSVILRKCDRKDKYFPSRCYFLCRTCDILPDCVESQVSDVRLWKKSQCRKYFSCDSVLSL